MRTMNAAPCFQRERKRLALLEDNPMKHLVLFVLPANAISRVVAAQLPAMTDQVWPHVIPCRIHDGTNPDLFVMTLGDVQTPIADGVFDPMKDEVTLKDGTVIPNYYRDVLGVKFYQPLDKSRFPAAAVRLVHLVLLLQPHQ